MQFQHHYSESPFLEYVDTQLEDWREGYIRIGIALQRHHLNRAGVVHGGLLATLLDHVGGFCGVYCADPSKRRYSVTLSMTCNFLAQRKTGYLVAVGEMVSGGTKIYFANTKVSDESGTIVATANSVHRYRGGSEGADGRPVIL